MSGPMLFPGVRYTQGVGMGKGKSTQGDGIGGGGWLYPWGLGIPDTYPAVLTSSGDHQSRRYASGMLSCLY